MGDRKWITQSDGTRQFHDQLAPAGMVPADADTLPAGAIIISPTSDTAVGHIGLLGAGAGGARLVYSNHSPSKANRVAEWEQNYTVAKFTAYHQSIGLPTYCYRLPNPAGANLLAQDISRSTSAPITAAGISETGSSPPARPPASSRTPAGPTA